MLDISRIRSGMLSLERKKVNLGELVRDVLERMKSQFIGAGCGSPILKNFTDVQGDWDAMRIEQVVINLLTNAIRYGAGKSISVSLECSNSKAWLRVKDHGIGVAKHSQEKIFNRFERAVDANNFSGLGLGLYISKQIIEAHGGRIWVESELGKGSTFFVELPLTKPHQIGVSFSNIPDSHV